MKRLLLLIAVAACARRPDLDFKPRLAPDFEERRNERPREAVAIGVSSRTVFTRVRHQQTIQLVPLTFMLRGVGCWSTLGQPGALMLIDDATGEPADTNAVRLYVRETAATNEASLAAFLVRESAETRVLSTLAETPETRSLLRTGRSARIASCVAARYADRTVDAAREEARRSFGIVPERADTMASQGIKVAQASAAGVPERANWIVYFRPAQWGFDRTPVQRDSLPDGLPEVRSALAAQQRAGLARIDANAERVQRIELELVCVSSTTRPCFEAGRSYRLRIAPSGREDEHADFRFRVARTSRAYAGLTGLALTFLFLIVQTG